MRVGHGGRCGTGQPGTAARTLRRAPEPQADRSRNDDEVTLVKVAGDFVWHSHDDTDELFLVSSGRLAEPRGVVSTGNAGGAPTATIEAIT